MIIEPSNDVDYETFLHLEAETMDLGAKRILFATKIKRELKIRIILLKLLLIFTVFFLFTVPSFQFVQTLISSELLFVDELPFIITFGIFIVLISVLWIFGIIFLSSFRINSILVLAIMWIAISSEPNTYLGILKMIAALSLYIIPEFVHTTEGYLKNYFTYAETEIVELFRLRVLVDHKIKYLFSTSLIITICSYIFIYISHNLISIELGKNFGLSLAFTGILLILLFFIFHPRISESMRKIYLKKLKTNLKTRED